MNILVCVKRVPELGADGNRCRGKSDRDPESGLHHQPSRGVRASKKRFVIIEKLGGSATVLTLGPPDAEEQLRDSMARGIDRGILLETDGDEWDPAQTASAIVEAIRTKAKQGKPV